MEKISRALFSMKLMTYAMMLFFLGIGAATFIESAYDIQTAKILIYNALWFEILLVYLAIILIANIFRYQMFSKEKIAMLVFHLSFILILIGAGITRFVSYEGLMLIREGQQSNFIYSSDPHLWFRINDGEMQYTYAEKLYMTEVKPLGMDLNSFSIPVSFPGHNSDIEIEYLGYQKKMIDSLVINDSINGSVLEIMTNGMQSNYLEPGGFLMAGEAAISFDKKDAMPGIYLFKQGAKIMMQSKLPVRYLPMAQMQKYRQSGEEVPDSLFVEVPVDSVVQFQTLTLYQSSNEQFVFKQWSEDTCVNARAVLENRAHWVFQVWTRTGCATDTHHCVSTKQRCIFANLRNKQWRKRITRSPNDVASALIQELCVLPVTHFYCVVVDIATCSTCSHLNNSERCSRVGN
mgnify:CR=1 FL=1